MGCCKYCSYGQSDTSSDAQPLSWADFEQEKRTLRREMAHIKTDDITQNELIEELQKRVKELQDIVCKLLDFVTYSTYDRSHLVDPSTTNPLKQEPNMHRWFTPFELLRRYYVGDYENDTAEKGFQLDDDIKNRVNPLPAEIISPQNYLPKPDEDDRPQDRIDIKNMFMGIGSESGTLESELSEYYQMLEDPTYKNLAIEMFKKLWKQGVMGLDDDSSDLEELTSP